MQKSINNLSIVVMTSTVLLFIFTTLSGVILLSIGVCALGVYIGNNDKKVIAQNRKYTVIRGL